MKRTLTRVEGEDAEAPQTGGAYLDPGSEGYGWDDVCALHKPAYKDGALAATWSA